MMGRDSQHEPKGNLLFENNAAIHTQATQRLHDRISQIGDTQLPASEVYTMSALRGVISAKIQEHYPSADLSQIIIDRPSIKGKKSVTSDTDLAMNIMPLYQSLETNQNPAEVARAIAGIIATANPLIQRVESMGPFVNMTFDMDYFSSDVFNGVEALESHYGWYRDKDPEVVVIDFSSPNIAKNLTVAHLRSTIIGQSLVSLVEASGDIPYGVNHVGDWGTHFGNIIFQYQQELAERGNEFLQELENDPAKTLMTIYRKFNDTVKNAPEDEQQRLLSEGRNAFLKLEQGDPESVELWQQFREWSLEEFMPIYERLGVEFDAFQGESFYEDKMPSAVAEAVSLGVLRKNPDGSVVFPSQPLTDPRTMETNAKAMMQKDGSPKDEIIVKPSGGTVYMTRDIAAILYRTRELGAKKLLYVIGKEQGDHCIELFNIAHQMGAVALGSAQHISFGHLNVDGKKMSSRSGKVVLLGELLDNSAEVAAGVLASRSNSDEQEEDLPEKVGVSATIFNDLKQDHAKDIEFDPERDLDKMVEQGALYIQLTYARILGILQKVQEIDITQLDDGKNYPEHLHKSERDIVLRIGQFPDVVQVAAKTYQPSKIATYMSNLAQELNTFRQVSELKVIDSNTRSMLEFRTRMLQSAAQTLENAAALLHIELPQKM